MLILAGCSSTEIPRGDSEAHDLTRDILLPPTNYSLYALIGPYEDLWFALDSFNRDESNRSDVPIIMKIDAGIILVNNNMLETYANVQMDNLDDAQKFQTHLETEGSSRIVLRDKNSYVVDVLFGSGTWGEQILMSIENSQHVPLNKFDPDGWHLMTNLPNVPDLKLVGVGAISRDMMAINMLTDLGELDLQFIARTYKTLNGGNVVFGAYTNGSAQITFHPEREFFQDSMRGLVFVTHSSYASPLVSFLVKEISEEMGMTNLLIRNSSVRHIELQGFHVIVKNIGSLVYLVISNDLNEAEKLIGSIIPAPGID